MPHNAQRRWSGTSSVVLAKKILECINCVVIRGVARSLSVGEWEGVEATDYRQKEQPITDKYIDANVQMSTNLTL